jgi:hypothetical protein
MKKPVTIQVIDEGEDRYVVATYSDGTVQRTLVDLQATPKRKPRKPIARAGLWKGRRKSRVMLR